MNPYLYYVKKMVLIIVLFMLLKPILPVLDYAVNYDYISKELCINKDKPKLQCNGKCHLMKELAKTSESEKPISSDKKQNLIEVSDLFMEDITTYNLLFFENQINHSLNSKYSNLYSNLNSYSFFHPPIFIV